MTEIVEALTRKLAVIVRNVRAFEEKLENVRRVGETLEQDLLALRMQRDNVQAELAAALVAEKEESKP